MFVPIDLTGLNGAQMLLMFKNLQRMAGLAAGRPAVGLALAGLGPAFISEGERRSRSDSPPFPVYCDVPLDGLDDASLRSFHHWLQEVAAALATGPEVRYSGVFLSIAEACILERLKRGERLETVAPDDDAEVEALRRLYEQ